MIMENFTHKCDTCAKHISTCDAIKPLFAEDRINPMQSIPGDTVLWCGEYVHAALSAIDPEDNALKVGRYFCAQMPCSPTDCTVVPCRYMKDAIANRDNRDPEAIRREGLDELLCAAKATLKATDRVAFAWKVGKCGPLSPNSCYIPDIATALDRLRSAILSAEPAQDDGKPEGFTVEAVNAGLEVGFLDKDASEGAWKIYRTNPFANRIGQAVFAEVKRRLEEAKE